MLSILRPAQLLEVCSISVPHHGLRLSGWMRHEIRDPYGPSLSQRMVALSKDARPLAGLTQVVEHGCRNDDVELRGADVEVTDVGLRSLDLARCHWAHPLDSAVEHRLAQVNERDVEIRQALQNLQCVIAGAASDVEEMSRGRRGRRRNARDQIQGEWRVHGRRLPGF